MLRKLIEAILLNLKYKRALRILAKQTWSVDFMVYLLRKAHATDLIFRVREPSGRILEIEHTSAVHNDYAGAEQAIARDELNALLGLREAK